MGALNTKMTALADEVRALSGDTEKIGIDAMTADLNAANGEVSSQTDIIAQIKEAVDGLPAAGGALQTKVVTPTKSTQNVTPDADYNGLDRVVVNPIPDEYIVPEGTLEVTENGTYDVTDKSSVNVEINTNTCYIGTTAPDPSLGEDNDIFVLISGGTV